MAMVKPIGVNKVAFDKSNASDFYFTSVGGDQVVKNKIIIRLNSTNAIVYQNTVTSFIFKQTVPSNTLTNNTYYNFSFITYDINNVASAESDPLSFYCYTTPTITFNNITNSQTITSASYLFNLTYNQIEGELLDLLYFELFDIGNNLISKSQNYTSISTPPISFSHLFEGFINNTTYKIKATATSINGTVVESSLITFNVLYDSPVLYSTFSVENKCNDGYNQITSNFIIIDGQTYYTPKYVTLGGETMLDLTRYIDYCKWTSGFSINKDFLVEAWFRVGILGQEIKLGSGANYFLLKYVREIPYGEVNHKDYIECIGYINNIEVFYMRSNYIEVANNNTKLVMWFKYDKSTTTYELILNATDYVATSIVWNGTSNATLNQMTDKFYASAEVGVEKNNSYGDMSAIYPITSVEIKNGIYDNLNISYDVTKAFTVDKPLWDYNTIINCDFNNNIKGGNSDIVLEQISGIKIKSRVEGSLSWITLFYIDVNVASDLNISKQDYICPSGVTMEYALVPIMNSGIEGAYLTTTTDVVWNKFFISDIDNSYSLLASVSYSDFSSEADIGIIRPINSKYPIVVQNSSIDFISGSVSGTLLDENQALNDRYYMSNLSNLWMTFLKNGKAKVLKDMNGNIFIVRISSSPTKSFNQVSANSIITVNFNFVEQGKWNVQEDLYKNRLSTIS